MYLGPIRMTSKSWVHPKVPINGSVLTTSDRGYFSKLLAFGQTGAKTELPDHGGK